MQKEANKERELVAAHDTRILKSSFPCKSQEIEEPYYSKREKKYNREPFNNSTSLSLVFSFPVLEVLPLNLVIFINCT